MTRAAVIDIVPTADVYAAADAKLAQAYFHWFFLTQEVGFPERMIAAAPETWLRRMFGITDAEESSPGWRKVLETYLGRALLSFFDGR